MSPTFVVPHWFKVLFACLSWALLLGFGVHHQMRKQIQRTLYVQQVLKPIWFTQETTMKPFQAEGEWGTTMETSRLQGRFVLLHFWATWCPPCRQEIPSLDMLARHFGNQLTVVTVSEDTGWEPIWQFLGKQRPSFQVWIDKDKQMANQFGVSQFPETFLISPTGRLIWKMAGPREWNRKEMIGFIQTLLDKKAHTALSHN